MSACKSAQRREGGRELALSLTSRRTDGRTRTSGMVLWFWSSPHRGGGGRRWVDKPEIIPAGGALAAKFRTEGGIFNHHF